MEAHDITRQLVTTIPNTYGKQYRNSNNFFWQNNDQEEEQETTSDIELTLYAFFGLELNLQHQ
jgi:hypothetical protein